MLLLELTNIKKFYADRQIFDIPNLKIYDNEKVGLIGLNGSGKTTLLNIINGIDSANEGEVKLLGECAYIRQIPDNYKNSNLSGGEEMLNMIEEQLGKNTPIVLADEPTSNLSLNHIQELQKRLQNYKGALIMVSHDKELLNAVCKKIIEIDHGILHEYSGNYDFYLEAKKLEKRQESERYENYLAEYKRLKTSMIETKQKAKSMTKAPKRMGNSEARLHKLSVKQKAGKVSKNAKVLEARLDRIEKVASPVEDKKLHIWTDGESEIFSKDLLECEKLTISFGEKVLLKDVTFKIPRGSKTVILGENGTGKTTILKNIMSENSGIKKAQSLKAAYFTQNFSAIDDEMTVYENVSEASNKSQTEIRNILGYMLFRGESVYKSASVLSGGEKVRLLLAKLFASKSNFLILDEPGNYLDIYSLEALSQMIENYEGTILYVSHDRSLIRLATRLLIIEGNNLKTYNCNYDDYLASKNSLQLKINDKNKLLILENRLSFLMAELSMKPVPSNIDELNKEYLELSKEIREIKSRG